MGAIFVQNIVGWSNLLVLWTISFSYEKLTKLVQLIENPAVDGLSKLSQNISRVSELICSRQDNPGTSKYSPEIDKLSGSFTAVLCCVV